MDMCLNFVLLAPSLCNCFNEASAHYKLAIFTEVNNYTTRGTSGT